MEQSSFDDQPAQEPEGERPAAPKVSRQLGNRSPLAGFKPFLLAGLVVVIGLLVGLSLLLRQSGKSESAPTTEVLTDKNGPIVPGAVSVGHAPSDSFADDGPLTDGSLSTPSKPASPSEYTFYETLKKSPKEPGSTAALTPKPKNAPPAANAMLPPPIPPPVIATKTPPPAAAAPVKTADATPPPSSAVPALQAAATPSTAKPAPSSAEAAAPAPKVATAVPPSAKPAAPKVIPRYTVQVAAFTTQADAEKLIAQLHKKGHAAYLLATQLSTGMSYRVRVGKYATREEATKAAQQLAAKEKLHPFVAALPPA